MYQQSGESREKTKEGLFAVIVGIDGYEDKPLHCAVNDAVYFAETLKKVWRNREVHIKTLIWPSLNEETIKIQRKTWGIVLPPDACGVTREAILTEVRDCANMAGEADTFIIYFSGHGFCTVEEPALVTIGEGKTAKGIEHISIREIQQAARNCLSSKKVMILDCCQNQLDSDKPLAGYKSLEELSHGWSILLSSSPGEVSLEDRYYGDTRDGYLQQGVFTASLVEGLRGGAASSRSSVSLAELAYFVGIRVPIEYQERILAKILNETNEKSDQNQSDTRGEGLNSQNPVLLCDAAAMGGSYQVVMAPEYVPSAHDSRRKIPSRQFLKYWFKFLIKPWPIEFPFKFAFHLAGLLYAAAMMFTVLLHSDDALNGKFMYIFPIIVALGSILIWRITLTFAVASNEDYWHIGGYFTVLFYFIWHCMIVIGFLWIYSMNSLGKQDPGLMGRLMFDLFFLFVGVVVFGCNASQTIIALAETLRSDDRRDIRQAIRVFEQFKYTLIGVDLFNYLAEISVRPDAYFYGWVISVTLLGKNLLMKLPDGMGGHGWIIIVREIINMALVTWLVFWYYAAYKQFQQEVYKR